MAEHDLARVLHHVRKMSAEGDACISDAQLLERFVSERDEAAFELIVWRHRRLVHGVSWRILQNHHDAQDAFQATFLALARKAHRISRRTSLAAWLYKVAFRAALTLRSRRAQRMTHEQPLVEDVAAPAERLLAVEQKELAQLLDEELNRLPERFRVAAVLCYLEGKTVDEAARLVGCPRGTLASRLARARQRLRTGLARRGVGLSDGALARALAVEGLSTAVNDSLVVAALRTATCSLTGQAASASGVPSAVATLTEEVLRTMFLKKLSTGVVALVLLAGVLLLGSGLTLRLQAQPEPSTASAADQAKPVAEAVAKDAQPQKQELRVVVPSKIVTVSQPAQREFTPYMDYTGRLTAIRQFPIRAPSSGRVLKVQYLNGGTVKKGDVLFKIELPEHFRDELARKKQAALAAEAKYKVAELDVSIAKERTKGALFGSRSSNQRVEVLAQQAKRELEASVEEVKAAEWLIDRLSIVRAPADGYVGSSLIAEGGMVSADVRSPTIMTYVDTTRAIGVRFDMDEYSYLRYQRLRTANEVIGIGSPLAIALVDEKDFPHQGTLDFFGSSFDPNTGTIDVHGVIGNPDPLLLPGMFARVRMPFGKPRRVLEIAEGAFGIPVFEANATHQQHFVWVVDKDSILARRIVKPGPVDRGMRVIEEGLHPEDWVVTSGLRDLHEGEKVEREPKGKPAPKP